jgi:hypothetical protein
MAAMRKIKGRGKARKSPIFGSRRPQAQVFRTPQRPSTLAAREPAQFCQDEFHAAVTGATQNGPLPLSDQWRAGVS